MSTVPENESVAALRPTWAEIRVDRYSNNLRALASLLPRGAHLVAVLKADGYGHGAAELARRAEAAGVAMIATALLEEALELRDAGIITPILVLGPMNSMQLQIALDRGVTIGVPGLEVLERACELARDRDVRVHLKLDSGMGRMGITERELSTAIGLIKSAPRLRLAGIYTHFANADDERDDFTQRQIAQYDAMLAVLRGAGIEAPLHHFANSAATLRRLVRPGDYARVGIASYGPRRIEVGALTIEPVMRWRTEVSRLKTLPAGHAVGYGTTFHTKRESRIATLPVGYADGFNRLQSNNAEVLVRGRRVPVVGRVSMDLVTIDVTDVDGAAVGDEVVLLGEQGDELITGDEMAARIGTISYEVFCNVSSRVPRVYLDGDRVVAVQSRFSR